MVILELWSLENYKSNVKECEKCYEDSKKRLENMIRRWEPEEYIEDIKLVIDRYKRETEYFKKLLSDYLSFNLSNVKK